MCHRGQLLVKSSANAKKAIELPCRSWLCAECYELRKKELIAQAHRGKPDTFITLTCRRNRFETPELAAVALAKAWRIVRKRALREAARDTKKARLPFGAQIPSARALAPGETTARMVRLPGGRFDFLAVIEKHKSGWPHIHVLARTSWIDQRWLSAQMADLLGSPVVHVTRIDTASKIAGYVAKYCGKAAHKFKSTKRYWQSRLWQLSKWVKQSRDDFPGSFERARTDIHTWIANQRSQGWHAWLVQPGHAMATAPPKASK